MTNEILERVVHRSEALGADVERVASTELARANAGVGQIVGVHELVAIVAAAEHVHRATGSHPLEEYLKDSQATVPEDRARPNDRHVKPFCDELRRDPFGLELGRAVR